MKDANTGEGGLAAGMAAQEEGMEGREMSILEVRGEGGWERPTEEGGWECPTEEGGLGGSLSAARGSWIL